VERDLTELLQSRTAERLPNFYYEFSNQGQERRLPMEHRPDEEGVEVYRRWRELNS
jgi:hypothetical protein